MKKNNLLKSLITLLIVTSMSTLIFSGCSNKQTETKSNEAAASRVQGNQSNTPGSGNINTNIKENIASLVTDGTITQAQADKIVEAFTTQRGNVGNRGGNTNGKTNDNGGSNSGQQQNKPQGTPPADQNPSQRNPQGGGQRMNPLSQLVTDGIITQEQADAVMAKIGNTFTRPQGNTNSNTQGNSSSGA